MLMNHLNNLLRQYADASASILVVSQTPFVFGFSMASTIALARISGFKGTSTAAPARDDNRPPIIWFAMLPIVPANAMGRVNSREESYKKPGRMKILRSLGKEDAIVDSASLFVVMYRLGNIGAPAAAEMKTKVGTFS